MQKTLIIISIILSTFLIGQKKYYHLIGDEILNEKKYQHYKDSISKLATLSEEILYSYNSKDELFIIPLLKITNGREQKTIFNQNLYFQKVFKNKIDFTNIKEIKNHHNIDPKKRYFINLWFVHCAPCIQEIPDLNILKELYKDAFNFIALTFDQPEVVEKFLQKNPFIFTQITNQKKLLDKMELNKYPTSFILDTEGNFISFVNYQTEKSQEFTKKLIEEIIRK